MLSLLKKLFGGRRILSNWHIPLDASYEKIDNGDSVQFINADNSRVLYFSVLVIKNSDVLPPTALTSKDHTTERTDDGWVFKAAKGGGNEVLVCAFSFTNESDEAYMKELFNKITYTGK